MVNSQNVRSANAFPDKVSPEQIVIDFVVGVFRMDDVALMDLVIHCRSWTGFGRYSVLRLSIRS